MIEDVPLPFDTNTEDRLLSDLTVIIEHYGYENVVRAVRRMTPTIVVGSAPARWTDPETSHQAAKREQDVGRFSQMSNSAKLLQLFTMRDMTDQQATIALVGTGAAPSAFEGIRRRCSDLRAARFLYDTGRRHKNLASNDESIVWGLSEAGKLAVERLDETGWSR